MNLLMSPHVTFEHADKISKAELFKSMPASFPDDVKVTADQASEPVLNEEQMAERKRRMAIPRLQRPR